MDVSEELIRLVLYGTIIIVCLAIIVFGIVAVIAFWRTKSGAAKSFGLLFQRGNFLRIATVILVIVATIFLAALGKIPENGAIAILSGVAGYVLGGLERGGTEESTEDDTSA